MTILEVNKKVERPFELKSKLWPRLAAVKHPSRYIGQEWGSIDKISGTEDSAVRICLAFPDTCEVGMSFLGFQIRYALANSLGGVVAERA